MIKIKNNIRELFQSGRAGKNSEKNKSAVLAWRQYEHGREYKRSINLYDTVSENERFYRGDQWKGVNLAGLPAPVFNITKRILDFLVNSAAAGGVNAVYRSHGIRANPERTERAVGHMNAMFGYLWERCKMDKLLRLGLLDAGISGDAVFYCYLNENAPAEQPHTGDIAVQLVDNVNFFVADVNDPDLQAQDYIIIAGRAAVSKLKAEAARAGHGAEQLALIVPDNSAAGGGNAAEGSAEKATYLIKFTRNAGGYVVWEKSVKELVISGAETGLTLYPAAYFSWQPVKNSFHGGACVTELKPNQKSINKIFAMIIKHMTDTAFSKVIYDRKLIPEWTNEVGQAIGVTAGGDVSSAVKIVGTGEMQSDVLKVLDSAIEQTKNMMGATEAALGEIDANNTSAILALQEASAIALEGVKFNMYQCVEDIANIWAEMICACHDPEFSDLNPKDILIKAKVKAGASPRFLQAARLNTLDKLLDGGHITLDQYLERLPDGVVADREGLMRKNG